MRSILLIFFILNSSHSSAQLVKKIYGSLSDRKSEFFNVDLWTFTVNSDSVINSTGFTIAIERSECVKALEINELKSVEFLPEKIFKRFPNLVDFNAENCGIKGIGCENFRELTKLVRLNLNGNELCAIKSSAFDDLQNLKFLSLNRNKIKKIDENSFKNLRNLQSLYLGHNRLTILHTKTFDNLTELRNISLECNRLNLITDRHFEFNQKLEFIWMANNDIKHFGYTMLNYMTNLKFVDFSFNHMLNDFIYEKH